MKQKLLNKLWLRVCMIAAVMTTALAGTAWAEEVTYTVTAKDAVSVSGTAPTGSSVTYSQTYGTKCQATAGNSFTLTLSGWEGYTITNITLSMKSNASKGAGALAYSSDGGSTYTYLVGSGTGTTNVTGVNFNDNAWNGAYTTTYTDISKDVNIEATSSNVIIHIRATTNSLYCESYKITYESSIPSSAVETTTVIDASGITNTDVYASTEAGSLSATVVDEDDNAVSGASVTWSSSNENVATIDANGVVTLVAAGTVTFTAQYDGVQDQYKASSATYEMTVTSSAPYVQPTVFDIALNNTLFGTTYTGSVSGLTDANPVSGTLNGVTVTYAGSGNHYINDSQIRFYPSNKLTFEAPVGYNITEIVFTSAGTWAATINADEGTYTSDTKTWEGEAATVLFTGSGSSRCDMSKVSITLEAIAPQVLSSIALGGTYPTTFHTGDAFSHEGMTVTATYDSGKTKDVTASATFTGYDMTTAGVQTVTVSYSEGEVTATATYDITVNAPATLTSIALSGTYPTEFQQGDAFSSAGIVVTAYYDDNTTADVTAEAMFSGYDMEVLGDQTVTVTYEGQTATYTITVVEKMGTENNPYTVAEAIAFINTLGSATSAEEVYVSGIISQVDSYSDTYHSIQYWISDDGTTIGQMEVYSGKGLSGADFSSIDDLKVGDIVTVKGYVKMYKGTPEFDKNNQLVSLDRPVVTTPTITASPTSITGFTYLVDNGPSAAKTFTVNGENLTGSLNVVLDAASNYEVSFNESSDYSDQVSSDASVLPRTIYVRLKAGLAVGEYSGSITLTSEGAETVTVALTGSVTAPEAPNVTWDLSTDQTATASETEMTWTSNYATMAVAKGGSSTKTNNYYPGTEGQSYTSTRFYKNSELTITPALGYQITSVVFEATTTGYATALKNSEWTNATASVENTTVTVTPTDGTTDVSAVVGGTCGFTSVKVYYQTLADFAPVWSALPTPTVTVGDDYEFYPSNYVAGLPAPSITLETTAPADTYVYENGEFFFSSATAGEYTFTFTATNTEGSASATLTITVEDAPVPVASIDLSATSIDAPYAGQYGTIDVTYNNLTDVLAEVQYVEADGTTPTTYGWVVADIDANNNVEYSVNENTDTDARTAYLKVYAVGNEGDAYSELITITQAGFVVDYATLPFVWNGGTKDELLAENGVTANGLGSDYAASNAPYRVKLDTTGDYIEIKTDCQPVLVSLDVKMLGGGNTSTIAVLQSNDGVTFGHVEDLTIEGVQNDKLYLQTGSSFDADTRYVRLVFTKGSNVGVGGITIEKEFEEIATVGAAGYATYVTKHNVIFPSTDVAYIGTVNGNYVTMTAITAAPKGTALILKGEGTYTLYPTVAGNLSDVSTNDLKSSETDVVADGTQYILAKPANEPVGFYQANAGTTIAAGKAYLEISSNVKAFYFSFDDDPTGINGQWSMVNGQPVYNLAGQRMNKVQRGINIVGGKKILK